MNHHHVCVYIYVYIWMCDLDLQHLHPSKFVHYTVWLVNLRFKFLWISWLLAIHEKET